MRNNARAVRSSDASSLRRHDEAVDERGTVCVSVCESRLRVVSRLSCWLIGWWDRLTGCRCLPDRIFSESVTLSVARLEEGG
jgi:hypothetical protein